MLFSSITFLYYFMPITFGIYYVLPMKYKNAFLFLASLIFYAWGEPKYVFIMLFSIISSFIFGLLIEHSKQEKQRTIYLVASIFISISFLVYFKYFDFLLMNIQLFMNHQVQLLHIALPIGISFFTFQTMSYVVDVYRKDVCANRNIINYGAYVSMFPQLIAGPIVRYIDIDKQLTNRNINYQHIYDGMCRFILGLAKKVVIANAMGELCDLLIKSNETSILLYWMYGIGFCLHIYYDFSAYSDMALGMGKMLGFDFLENFDYPFVSKSITEFWRRWHISLGKWFRDYVYIPLGGNRKGMKRTLLNILIVWLLTGLWHGAAYQFIAWGLMFAGLLLIEKLYLLEHLKKHPYLGHVYTLFFVMISFILFNASSIQDAFIQVQGLFSFTSYPLVNDISLYYLRSYALLFVISIVGATPLIRDKARILRENIWISKLESLILIGLLLLCTAYLVDNSFNPFLYFRF